MNPTKFQEERHWKQEFERRTKAMPFTRFVKNGEPLPTEIGNVDKMPDYEGTGFWYMFPSAENLQKSYGDRPEDPTLGQEAQGGPIHSSTGRGEKYRDGNVETAVVAEGFKNPQAEGAGSQTSDDKGIQRAVEGDGSAIGGAVEDPDVNNKADQHPSQEEGADASEGTARSGGVRIRTVDTSTADALHQGEKTATDEAAQGAATPSHSLSDLEKSSPEEAAGDRSLADFDVENATVKELQDYLDKAKGAGAEGVDYKAADNKPALQEMARKHQQTLGLAKQKSDEAVPTSDVGKVS